MTSAAIKLHQIVYDAPSRAQVFDPLIPLENEHGPKDWFEFWPILDWLRTHSLNEDVWYGFVSPKFFDKCGLNWDDVRNLIDQNQHADVALFTFDWFSIAYDKNVWTHGERMHPGLIAATHAFLKDSRIDIDLTKVTTDFESAVFSNYVIAKPAYWYAWLSLAEKYWSYLERAGSDVPDRKATVHAGKQAYELKVFVQERFPSIVLLQNEFTVVYPDYPSIVPSPRLQPKLDTTLVRALLRMTERYKRQQRKKGKTSGSLASTTAKFLVRALISQKYRLSGREW